MLQDRALTSAPTFDQIHKSARTGPVGMANDYACAAGQRCPYRCSPFRPPGVSQTSTMNTSDRLPGGERLSRYALDPDVAACASVEQRSEDKLFGHDRPAGRW